MDYVPTLFKHTRKHQITKQQEDRQKRVDQRRQLAEIQAEASNALVFAKQAEGSRRVATVASKKIGLIVETAKQASELAEATKREANKAKQGSRDCRISQKRSRAYGGY